MITAGHVRGRGAAARRDARTGERRPERASAMPSRCFCASRTLVTCRAAPASAPPATLYPIP